MDNNNILSEGHCIMVDVPNRNKILEFVQNLPNECVYEEEGKDYGKETNPHVTVMYGLSENEEKRVKELLTKVPKRIVAELGQISKFENADTPYDVLKIEVKSPHLAKLHEMIKNNFENNYKWPEYNPHVTLAYVKKGTCNEHVGSKIFEGMKFNFENFTYSNGNREQNHKVNMKEYFVGQGGGYGGAAGGSIAAGNWAGTYSSPQTSNRLNLHPDTGVTSYMQGNTIVRNALPDTILPQDIEGTPYDPDEIRLGLRSEMKKQEFPDKTKAKDVVLQNLAKNPKFYSDLLQYINSDKGNIMENENDESYEKQLAMGIEIERDHYDDKTEMCKTEDADALATIIAKRHLKDDKNYYKKLKAAGLDEGAMTPSEAGYVKECECDGECECDSAETPIAPDVAIVKISGPVDGSQQKLSSSELGKTDGQKPLTTTKLTSPGEKNQVGPNKIIVSKTPPLTGQASCDPLDYFGSQMTEKW
jgi:2'-5' RNA ligase